MVTHTDPEHESLLPEIIRRKSKAAVKLIQDGMKVEENTPQGQLGEIGLA